MDYINLPDKETLQQAEESLIASLLIDGTGSAPTSAREVGRMVNASDFTDSQRRRVYEGIMLSPHVDQITVAQTMQDNGSLKPGDIGYMSHIMAELPTSLDYLWYARSVKRYSLQRKLLYYEKQGNQAKVSEIKAQLSQKPKGTEV